LNVGFLLGSFGIEFQVLPYSFNLIKVL